MTFSYKLHIQRIKCYKTFYELEKSIGASSVHKHFDLTDVSKPPEHTQAHTKFQHPLNIFIPPSLY